MNRFGIIYEIRNTVNNKRYIGSTIHPKTRKGEHFKLLRGTRHHSIVLQRAWDKYGEAAFFFSVIENNVPQDYLIEREQYWIDKLQPEYNIAKFARASSVGRQISEATRLKLRMARMGKSIVTDEGRASISKSHTGNTFAAKPILQIDLYTNEVIKIWSSASQAARELGYGRSTIFLAVSGKSHIAVGYMWKYKER